MYLVQCPKCHNRMKYNPKGFDYRKAKTCVYCGTRFSIRDRIVKKIG